MAIVKLDLEKSTLMEALGTTPERSSEILTKMEEVMREAFHNGNNGVFVQVNGRELITGMLNIAETYEEAIGIAFKMGSKLKELSMFSDAFESEQPIPDDDALEQVKKILKGEQ